MLSSKSLFGSLSQLNVLSNDSQSEVVSHAPCMYLWRSHQPTAAAVAHLTVMTTCVPTPQGAKPSEADNTYSMGSGVLSN